MKCRHRDQASRKIFPLRSGMAKLGYQGNWRGAWRYRFDDETQLKKVARARSRGLLPSIVQAFKSLPTLPVAFLLIGAAGVGYTRHRYARQSVRRDAPRFRVQHQGQCERRYRRAHLPCAGTTHYHDTVISMGKGERWFCSEAEAQQAGWRKAWTRSAIRGQQVPLIIRPKTPRHNYQMKLTVYPPPLNVRAGNILLGDQTCEFVLLLG